MQLLEEKAKTAARRRLNTATGWVDSERAHLCASLQVSIMRRQLARVDAAIHDLQYLTTSKMLLRVGPAEARRKDRAGRLPLHWAEACRAPDPIKQLLTSVFPAGSTETDDSNSTPAMLRPAVDRAALVAETAQDEFKGCKNCRGPATVLCMWSQLADHEKHLARKLGWGPHSWDQVHCLSTVVLLPPFLAIYCLSTASFPCISLPPFLAFHCLPLPPFLALHCLPLPVHCSFTTFHCLPLPFHCLSSWDQVQPARCDACVRRGIKKCLTDATALLRKGHTETALSTVSATILLAKRHPQLVLACLTLRADLLVMRNDVWGAISDLTVAIGSAVALRVGDRHTDDEGDCREERDEVGGDRADEREDGRE